jgi:hypothetical protein
MADRDSEALPPRDGLGLGELAPHRVDALVVVEEDVARHARHTKFLRDLVADGLRRGA